MPKTLLNRIIPLLIITLTFACKSNLEETETKFVERRGHQFFLNDRPYYYIGTNYWYGGYLGLEGIPQHDVERLREELDFLKSKGVTNLRVLAGVEGSGQINGVPRVQPPLQPEQGEFSEENLKGLDLLLKEMGERDMKAIIFLSNNWEWSGGFLQYVNWNGGIEDSVLQRKLNWDELRDYTAKFYSCEPCKEAYLEQADLIINRINELTGQKYTDDPTIMTWELANEPRPMRPRANKDYKNWISNVAAQIKEWDPNHLVTIGHEGVMATDGNMELYKAIHSDPNINYATIHIWPKNWGWFDEEKMAEGMTEVRKKALNYLEQHEEVAREIDKPLVLEEFGLPRDKHSFDPEQPTVYRDEYYRKIFEQWRESRINEGVLAGLNFWTFNGSARPIEGQIHWKEGDPYMGDPPMEEQGLNGVFATDSSTWQLIEAYTQGDPNMPNDPQATEETKNLYQNLKLISDTAVMFGHQDDLAYGVNWKYEEGRSDVKDVAGSYPAVYGFDMGEIANEANLDGVPFEKMKEFMKDAYRRGGVVTISWHMINPVTETNSWDTTRAVEHILPGGKRHEYYKGMLDRFADFASDLKVDGISVPILFRPFHEHTGSWFWWGEDLSTVEEYKALWRFTVEYLRDDKELHNILYVYSTDVVDSEEEYLERYPGDEYIDILGIDDYQSVRSPETVPTMTKRLAMISKLADEKGKVSVYSETGSEAIPNPKFWTEVLLAGITGNPMAKKIGYVMVWRNHSESHHYGPYPGHPSAENFKEFANHDLILLEDELPALYKQPHNNPTK